MRWHLGVTAAMAISLASSFSGQTVEVFTGSASYDIAMPGTVTSGGVVFSGTASLTSIDFAPGSIGGVDFDGTEGAWLASSYSGTGRVPQVSGSGSTTIKATGSASGAASCGGVLSLSNVQLGSSYGASFLDVVVSSALSWSMVTPSWVSSAVPALNGSPVAVSGSGTVTSVDAVNGVVSGDCTGTVAIVDPVPSMPLWAVCSTAALFLIGGTVLLTRRGGQALGAV